MFLRLYYDLLSYAKWFFGSRLCSKAPNAAPKVPQCWSKSGTFRLEKKVIIWLYIPLIASATMAFNQIVENIDVVRGKWDQYDFAFRGWLGVTPLKSSRWRWTQMQRSQWRPLSTNSKSWSAIFELQKYSFGTFLAKLIQESWNCERNNRTPEVSKQ